MKGFVVVVVVRSLEFGEEAKRKVRWWVRGCQVR